MAKKEITANSSPTEIRIANEQLRKAQQEYRAALEPFAGKSLSLIEQDRIAQSVASKYDYVDFGADPALATPGEINIGGINTFYVKGLGSKTQTNFPPETNTSVKPDDAFPTTRPNTGPTQQPNSQGQNPNEAVTDQSVKTDVGSQTAVQNNQVQTETGTNTTGSKDSTEAGAALEKVQKNSSTNTQDGVVNQNPNDLPSSGNNKPGRLSDEYLKEPGISDGRKKGNSDDDVKGRPMGTAITGFTNIDAINVSPDAGSSSANTINIGTTESVTIPEKTAGTPNNPKVPIRPNILHNYVNWTYKIGLYLLKIPDYNTIVEGGNIPEAARQYPVAISGGYPRKNAGTELRDFYIEDLRFTSVIGNRLSSSATNNIDIEMSIIEPYGASFIGEIGTLAAVVNGINITLAENPYLLEIDFAGYKDDGSMVPSILGTTSGGKKYIPVKIIAIEMKIDAGGARYKLTMVPYGFYQFTQKRTSLPKDVFVYGETINDILGDNEYGLIGRLNNIENEKKTKDQKQDHADVYKIKFYSFNKSGSSTQELEQSKVAFPTEGGPATIIKNREILKNEPNKQGYTIKAGTLLKEVIKDLVLVSEYFNTKMKPNANDNKNNSNPAELLKVIPQIKLLTDKWDSKRNEYAKEVTFHVFNTLLFGENFANGGLAPIRDWGYSKVYDYIFTGKNVDIINVDVNFNLLYYTKFFTDKNELGLVLTDMVAERTSTGGSADSNKFSETNAVSGFIGKTSPNEPSRYINASLVAEFFDVKMNNSYADMVTLDMDIIGDPDWIPQDSSIRGGPISVGDATTKLDKFGSIAVDVAGTYAKLQLRTPRDYNDKTGLMDLSKDSSLVGGVYQVVTVDNLFQGGKYTCKLNMVKIPNQEENKKTTQQVTASQFRAAESNPFTAGQLDNTQRIDNPAVNVNATGDIPNGTRA